MLKKLLLTAALASISFAATIPRPSGELAFSVPGKGPAKISSYHGKIIIVAVFITECPECQRTTKRLKQIQEDHRAQGVQVVELAFRDEDNQAAVEQFVKIHKPNFPVGIVNADTLAKWGQLTAEMRPTVPMLFFIDRNGYIQGQYMGADPFMSESIQDSNIRGKLKGMLR
jgi:hypothetical protein